MSIDRDLRIVLSNINTYVSRKEAGLIVLADQFGRGKMTRYAKTHRRWIDRTSRSVNGLNGGGFKSGDSIISFVAHAVDYGIWLEKANFGKYAILNETIENNAQEFKRYITRYLNE